MKSIKPIFLFLYLSVFGCSVSLDQTEVAQSVSTKIGVSASDINQVSKCLFSMPASKSSRKGDWHPCVVAETNNSISLLRAGELAFSAQFDEVESIGFPKSHSSHEVQILKGETLVSFQILKQLDLVDDEAGKVLFERMESKGITVNHDAVRIIHGH